MAVSSVVEREIKSSFQLFRSYSQKKSRNPVGKWFKKKNDHANLFPRHGTNNLVLLALAQDVTELLKRAADELSLLPEVRSKEAVGVDDSKEGGLEGVLEGLGGAGRGGVGILDTGKLEQTLNGGGGNKAGTTGSGDKLFQVSMLLSLPEIAHFMTYSDGDGTTLGALLNGQRVRLTKVAAPVTTTDGENGELGNGDSGTDGGSDFLGGLDTETDVALRVTDDDDGLETGTLTGTGLLLDGLDL